MNPLPSFADLIERLRTMQIRPIIVLGAVKK